jgi:fatty-acyl-CoA synthase
VTVSRIAPRPHHAHWPRRLPRELAVPETALAYNLEVTATRHPRRAATLFFGRSTSWAEIRAQAEALAGWLYDAAGVRRGDRVALFLQNCPQFVTAFHGALRADAVVVPVNPMNRADELRHVVADSGARVVVCGADLVPVVDAALRELPPPAGEAGVTQVLVVRYADAMPPDAELEADERPSPVMHDWLRRTAELPPPGAPPAVGWTHWRDAVSGTARAPAPAAQPDDLALLHYTSGTTGLPKGCMHTHRTLMSNAVGGQWSHASTESVALAAVPMFHITGLLYGVVAPAFLGSTCVVLPRWDRELAGRLIARHRVTHWTCIPTMVIDLFGSPDYRSFDLSSLRNLSGGGAAMPQAVAQRLIDEFGITFAEGYGLTETAAPTHANPPERAKLQCLGMPIFGVDSRVVDPVTLQEMPVGETGEIVTRGPMVFEGYWRNPEATAAAFVEIDGERFFRTGDLGRMDDEGYFFLTDRLKRMINASGYKVWPAEVELLLYKHPAVQEACVVATRDAYRGESVKAVVVLRAEARGVTTGAQLIDWAREHMAAYKVPRVVEFVDALPRSGAGKVLWRVLQEREAAAAAARPPSEA